MLVLAAGLLGACSALRFGYNQADELAYWWLDGYLDFNDNQTPKVRQALTQWHAWHRRTQLPDYLALLVKARTEAAGNLPAERMCTWWGDVRGRLDVALEQAVPAAAAIALSLTSEQLQHIERRYAKGNEEFRNDYLQADTERRLKEAVNRAVERAESFYGRLDDAQRDRIAKSVAQSPFDAELWFGERKLRQQEAMQMLRRLKTEAAGVDQAQADLRTYMERSARSPRADYRRYAEQLTQYNCAFASTLHNATNAAQRAVLIGKVKGWEADLRAVTADGNP